MPGPIAGAHRKILEDQNIYSTKYHISNAKRLLFWAKKNHSSVVGIIYEKGKIGWMCIKLQKCFIHSISYGLDNLILFRVPKHSLLVWILISFQVVVVVVNSMVFKIKFFHLRFSTNRNSVIRYFLDSIVVAIKLLIWHK